MSNISLKYKELIFTLKALESRLFVHAASNQVETVESFLSVAVRKAKLEDQITLIANWGHSSIANKKITIIISAQNEIPNIVYVEEIYKELIGQEFKYLKFLKYVEYLPTAGQDNDTVEDLSALIASHSVSGTSVKVKDLKFHVAKFGADEYNRKIKIVVFVDEIIDKLIKPASGNEHWIPDSNLFYLMDLVFGEYYMTTHISNINFFPVSILATNVQCMTATEAKSAIEELLNLSHKTCIKCKVPEYRVKLDQAHCCPNCSL